MPGPGTPGEPGNIVVVGAGQASVQLADSLRAGGHTGGLTLLEQEGQLPYQRPPLSKDHLAGKAMPVPLRGSAFYGDRGVVLRRDTRVEAIDTAARTLHLADGASLAYHTLVLATGSANRALDVPGADLAGVQALRTLGEADALRAALDVATAVVVVGAGFVGLELAAAARARGLPVTVLEAAPRPLGRAVSAEVSAYVAAQHRRLGIHLRLGTGVRGLEGRDGHVTAAVDTTGARHPADLVLVGIGAVARDGLAAAAGLAVNAGVLVDAALRTSDPHVYAIGDCARFPSVHLGVPTRLESVQNAAEHGRHLARVLLGDTAPFISVPTFFSHQGPLRLQIAGLAAADDMRVPCGDVAAGRFSVLSYRVGRLVAVESINRPADHLAARTLLAQRRGPDPDVVAAAGFSLRDFARRSEH